MTYPLGAYVTKEPETPVVEVPYAVVDGYAGDDDKRAMIICPNACGIAGGMHIHGVGSGMRRAHCVDISSEYMLRPATGPEAELIQQLHENYRATQERPACGWCGTPTDANQ